jgi:DNA-binding HxlR family transcriptional regulator
MIKGENAREKVTREILSISIDGKEHRFSDYNKTCKTTNATISKYLKELTNKKRLRKTPGQENEAFRPKYHITSKGRECFLELSNIDVQTGCALLQDIFKKAADPNAFRKWYKEKNTSNWNEMVKKPFSEENIKEYERKEAALHSPLADACATIHEALTLIEFESEKVDYNQYATIIKGDGSRPLTIPLWFLEGIDFERLHVISKITFEDQKGNTQDQKIRWTPTLTGSSVAANILFHGKTK